MPDNVATIENAFTGRSQAEKYLFTCYSYMPHDDNLNGNPGLTGGDEIIPSQSRWPEIGRMFNIALGKQNIVNPIGSEYWTYLYQGIRDCNIFLEHIDKVPGITSQERIYWKAEVKVLKAYYHFLLVRMYGAIPLIKTNLPITASTTQVKVLQDPVDSCFSYIINLLDEAKDSLPAAISEKNMLGRISRPVAYSFKAKVAVYQASPLFNGNTDQASLQNKNGVQLFNQTTDNTKWHNAVTACKEAITICHSLGYKLYTSSNTFKNLPIKNETKFQLSVRNSFTEKFNDEIIWANTQSSMSAMQLMASVKWDPQYADNVTNLNIIETPLKIAELFYTQNGLPIDEDKTWDYEQRYNLKTAAPGDALYIKSGYTTASLNFYREPHFYAFLGFDGGVWYGQGNFDDSKPANLFTVASKKGQLQGIANSLFGPVTGYAIKKYVHVENTMGRVRTASVIDYPFPLIRLADLYLLYAEALNEASGPSAEALLYLDMVRARAGLPSVETAWSNYGKNPAKPATKEGLRNIIHRERNIELLFEANRYWDLKRWKESIQTLNTPLSGWDIMQESASGYYKSKILFLQNFTLKDYFWPISESELTRNPNLVQNTGWR